MAEVVLMPQIGITVESCIITQWLKQPGDPIKVGDILFTYETDKSSLECESTAEGELLEVFFHNGDEVPVLTPVCAIGTSGEDISHLRPQSEEETPEQDPALAPPATTPEETTEYIDPVKVLTDQELAALESTLPGDRVAISPRARNLAKEQHVDIAQATGTGPNGRIIERDIRHMLHQGIGLSTPAAAAQGVGILSGTGIGRRVGVEDLDKTTALTKVAVPQGPEYEDVSFSGIRRAISRSMTKSLAEIPQLTHNHSFDASAMLEYRSKIKDHGDALGLPNITLNDILLYAVSRTLLQYPALNAHMLDGETIRQYHHVHLGMAVDTPRGLMVPVIQYADLKTLAEISQEAKELAQGAIDGTLSPDKMRGGTFTVSNLGTLGVESFTPVINPPETGILGVDNIITRVREVDGEITTYPAMGLSITYDHRAIDGAPASRFVGELIQGLENFSLLLAN